MELKAIQVEGIKKEDIGAKTYVKLNEDSIMIEERKKGEVHTRKTIHLSDIINLSEPVREVPLHIKVIDLILDIFLDIVYFVVLFAFAYLISYVFSKLFDYKLSREILFLLAIILALRQNPFDKSFQFSGFCSMKIVYWNRSIENASKINIICSERTKTDMFLFIEQLDMKLKTIKKSPEVSDFSFNRAINFNEN